MLEIVTVLFVFINVTEDINISVVSYPAGHIFDPGMFFAGSVVETVVFLITFMASRKISVLEGTGIMYVLSFAERSFRFFAL